MKTRIKCFLFFFFGRAKSHRYIISRLWTCMHTRARTRGITHYLLHSNSYIATAADCLATAARRLGAVRRLGW